MKILLTIMVLTALMLGCSSGDTQQGIAVNIIMTAPGDDGMVGQASGYDVRWATFEINADNFDQATPVDSLPLPGVAGSIDTAVALIPSNTTFWAAAKAVDEAGNWSELSNVVAGETPDHFPPSPPVIDSVTY